MMHRTWTIVALLAAALAAGCATKKGFEKPGFAYGCPIGDDKASSMADLVKLKVVSEGKRTTIEATEMRCTMTGDLLKIDANLNNDSSRVKRVAYKLLDRPRRHARLGRGNLEAAAHVREFQPHGQRRVAHQQGRGLPPAAAEPGVVPAADGTMSLMRRGPIF